MAQLGSTFDPSTVPDDDRSFDLIPAGWQPMHAIETDVQATKDGTGQMLVITWEVLEGPFAKRRIWTRINIVNKSSSAQEIGQRDLGSICKALNLGPIGDSKEIEFKALMGRVGVEPGKDGFEAKNKVAGYKPYGSAGAPQNTAPQQGAQRQAAASTGTGQAATGGAPSRPWGNKAA